MTDVYDLARRYIAKAAPAVSGQGGHDQTFSVACALIKGFDFSIAEARPLLQEYNQRCEPPWSEAELEHKLRSADAAADSDAFGGSKKRGWLRPSDADGPRKLPPPKQPETKPIFHETKLAKFAARWRPFVNTAWLADRSAINPYQLAPRDFLIALYGFEKVVIFTNNKSQGQALYPEEEIPLASAEGVWFLAQPVDGEYHPNPRNLNKLTGEPIPSRRSEESVAAWRFLVLESDKANPRDWLAAIVQLPLAISAIYTSGRRSIHALVRVDASSLEAWRKFAGQVKRVLVTLGADQQVAATAVRLSRLPGCYRGPSLQKLLYLNPQPEAKPIILLPRKRDVLGEAIARAKVQVASAADVIEQAGAKNLDACIAALDSADTLKSSNPSEAIAILKWFESEPAAHAALSAFS